MTNCPHLKETCRNLFFYPPYNMYGKSDIIIPWFNIPTTYTWATKAFLTNLLNKCRISNPFAKLINCKFVSNPRLSKFCGMRSGFEKSGRFCSSIYIDFMIVDHILIQVSHSWGWLNSISLITEILYLNFNLIVNLFCDIVIFCLQKVGCF